MPEYVACAIAALSTLDAWFGLWSVPVLCAGILILGVLALTALRGRRSGTPPWVLHHAPIGMLLIAVLLIASTQTGATPEPQEGHAHGRAIEASTITALASIGAIGYAVLTVFALPRVTDRRARVPIIVMAVILLLLAGSLVG